ncbi:hypothetical protein CL176_11815 [Suicoccus acidiformans]|uniref:Aminotransferase class I/classII large domain-containing protein n=1 Tax=Suicoccus acidiformans TaxID=2036206 RepID=A0A347WNH5_9LACT|nr:histidinol-phosphate transaminase [Suicoccus acidiformans]AXY26632.1 hypothetical protein CL176_11815 [Suicoccus acidiformans]
MLYDISRNTSTRSPIKASYMEELYQRTHSHLYPDTEINTLKALYAKRNQLPIEEIEFACGADEWIQKVFIVFGQDGIMSLSPEFFMFHDYAAQLELPFFEIPANEQFQFDFQAIRGEILARKPSLFILSNPHNPTGQMFAEADLQLIADTMEEIGGYFVIDEVYSEFAETYNRPEGDHILIIRSLSKIYGLAGVRIGVIIAQGETYKQITRINHPYPLDIYAINIACILLEDEEWLNEFMDSEFEASKQLNKSFEAVDDLIQVIPSHTNFVFTYGEHAVNLGEHLLKAGFKARFYEEDNLKACVRYSIMPLEAYPAFNQAIAEWRKQF